VGNELPDIWITSGTEVILDELIDESGLQSETVVVKTSNHKCGRCWRHLPDVSEEGALCGRCEDVLSK